MPEEIKSEAITDADPKKKKSVKKAIIITAVTLAVLAVTAFAVYKLLPSELYLEYTKTDGGYWVSGYSGKPRTLTIPSEHEGEPVIGIAGFAFYKCKSLEKVTIPGSVKSIEFYAFWHCTSLTSLTLSDGLESIEDNAFSDCAFTSLAFPNSVKEIDTFAFSYCTELKSVTLPNKITKINDFVFYGCSALDEITIPKSVKEIGENTFCCSHVIVYAPHEASFYGQNEYASVKKWIVQ